ncbi:hypothetical protein EV361DRAFT_1013756 [Lentinula raphanica]|nr:hypothetical protein F5880DRAFT_1011014 [Lentinula raphanica]KAJ3966416.1 hypothetical protein EV361DRAFT_1013756 [Lentinula raphanica]
MLLRFPGFHCRYTTGHYPTAVLNSPNRKGRRGYKCGPKIASSKPHFSAQVQTLLPKAFYKKLAQRWFVVHCRRIRHLLTSRCWLQPPVHFSTAISLAASCIRLLTFTVVHPPIFIVNTLDRTRFLPLSSAHQSPIALTVTESFAPSPDTPDSLQPPSTSYPESLCSLSNNALPSHLLSFRHCPSGFTSVCGCKSCAVRTIEFTQWREEVVPAEGSNFSTRPSCLSRTVHR